MKIVFFGTSALGLPALEKLHSHNFEIITVVSTPDKPIGRRQELIPSPVKQWTLNHDIPILQPSDLKSPNQKLIPTADLCIVASYGKIIPGNIIAHAKYGTLNIHPSLLPCYRGPSPIQNAILNGDIETGVTIMKLDAEMDHGPILKASKLSIDNKTYTELHRELAIMGAELLLKVLPEFISGQLIPKEQDHAKATYTKKITKADARIDWRKSAVDIDRQIRAYNVWPIAWTIFQGKRLKIFESTPLPRSLLGTPGQIIKSVPNIFISCGEGMLQIKELQLEGSKKMSAEAFSRGHQNILGKILGQ